MMKKAIFILFCIAQVSAQNLISNPSFEDTLSCPYGPNQIGNAAHWSNPNWDGTPDYFNICNNSINGFVGVPNSSFGYQYARTGNAYAGVAAYIDSNSFCYQFVLERNYREFIQNELVVKLDTGKTYCGGYWVNLSNGLKNYASDGFRMRLTENPTLITGMPGIYPSWPPDNYVQNYNGIISDTSNWVLVSDTFIAEGNEKYALIGNLDNCNQTGHIQFSNDSTCYAYYLIDDVFIYEQKPVFITEGNFLQRVDTMPGFYLHGNNAVFYEWYFADSPGTILSDQDNVFLDLPVGSYDVVLKGDACHYTSYDTIHIVIIPYVELMIPGGFSPNGDGINDVFFISGLENYPQNSLFIINRWGDLIYRAEPYKNDWDGNGNVGARVDNAYVTDGTYFYVFTPSPGDLPIKGSLEIRRY